MPADGEPYWLDSDRDIVTAHELEEKSMCPCGCGEKSVDVFAKKNQFAYRAESIRCFARAALDREKDRYQGQDGADTAGLLTRLTQGPHGKI